MSETLTFGAIARTFVLAGATLSTGLAAGLFFAFAVSVMPGLSAQSDAGFVSAMQAINERIQNPLFFLSFFGAVVFLILTVALHYPVRGSSPVNFWLVTLACILYVGGVFLLTVFVNVPMNDALALVLANAPMEELSAARETFESPWNFWNAVRTVFSISSFLLLVIACLMR